MSLAPSTNKFSYTAIENPYPKVSDDSSYVFDEYYNGNVFGMDFESSSFWDGRTPGFFTRLNQKFYSQAPSGLLFPAVLYNAPGVLVFERPPTHKFVEYVDVTVEHIDEDQSFGVHTFNLPLPWQLYVAEYDPKSMLVYKVHMYFMNESFKNVNQIMYSPPLPNFYANGALCRPYIANMEDIERYEKTLSGVMAASYDWIWNSGFNHDLAETINSVYYHKKNSFYDPNHVKAIATKSWHRFCHPSDLIRILKIWETFDINNILDIKWANLSVTNLWEAEIEWFYENEPDYPYGDDCAGEHESMEEYSENIPQNSQYLEKTFSIMMLSVCLDNQIVHSNRKDLSHMNRFALYHKLLP
jgi:hypothetical protein